MKDALNRHGALKVYAVLVVKFVRIFNGKEQISSKSFIAKTRDIFATTLLGYWFNDHVKQSILRDVKEFEENGSDWKLHLIERSKININIYYSMRASSYIDLPQQIKRKKACVNIKVQTSNVLNRQYCQRCILLIEELAIFEYLSIRSMSPS